jgi:hypothetical protein
MNFINPYYADISFILTTQHIKTTTPPFKRHYFITSVPLK